MISFVWQSATMVSPPAGSTDFADICWSPEAGCFVAVGAIGTAADKVARSVDGINWTFHSLPDAANWTGVDWSPTLGLFAAINSNNTNKIATSPDGITWTRRLTGSAFSGRCMTWCSGLNKFIAGSSAGSTTSRFLTSPDGLAWTLVTGTPNRIIQSICWSPELSLAVAGAYHQGGTIADTMLTSPDGNTWTAHNLPSNNGMPTNEQGHGRIAWSSQLGLFCAVLDLSNVVAVSSNGTSWTYITDPGDPNEPVWRGVAWVDRASGPKAFVVVGTVAASGLTVFMESEDGTAWGVFAPGLVGGWRYPAYARSINTFVVTANTTFIALVGTQLTGITIDSVTPSIGGTEGGTVVSIAGSNFDTDVQVVFDHIFPTSLVWNSSSSLTAVVPPHAAGFVTVTATNPDDGDFDEGVDLFQYVDADLPLGIPRISLLGTGCAPGSISPANGSMAGGTAVTIHGSGFQQGSTVLFGGLPATSVVIDPSGTFLTCITPAHQTGAVDVEVISP